MARFDVYTNSLSKSPPYLLQVQAEFHDHLDSRIIIPMMPLKTVVKERMSRLNVEIEMHGQRYLLMTADMAAVPKTVLGKRVASVADQSGAIVSAIDFLFEGF